MEIIDSHIHPPLSDGSNFNWFPESLAIASPNEYVGYLKDAGITRCCGAVIARPKGDDDSANIARMNQSALEFGHKVGDFYMPGFQLDLTDPDKACSDLDYYYHKEGVRWIGEMFIQSLNQNSLIAAGAFEVYDLAQNLGIPVSIHNSRMNIISQICNEFPRLNVVLSHVEMSQGDLMAWLDFVRQHTNLYIDPAPSITSRFGLIKKIVQEVGAHKVVFGSGFPIRSPKTAVASYLGSGLNDLQLESVMSLNFKQLTGLN